MMKALLCAAGLTAFLSHTAHACTTSIATGIDISGSVDSQELLLQLDGMSQALQSPAVLSAIQSGGCANMAVFVWSSIEPIILLPWVEVGTEEQAAQAIATLLTAAKDIKPSMAGLTNTGSALDFAYALFSQVSPAGRQVVNIISNGEANEGEQPPAAARARLLAAGATINGVAFGPSAELETWFRENVTGGRGSFVLRVDSAQDFASVFRSKFIMDLSSIQ